MIMQEESHRDIAHSRKDAPIIGFLAQLSGSSGCSSNGTWSFPFTTNGSSLEPMSHPLCAYYNYQGPTTSGLVAQGQVAYAIAVQATGSFPMASTSILIILGLSNKMIQCLMMLLKSSPTTIDTFSGMACRVWTKSTELCGIAFTVLPVPR
ncbi:hypothetical protein Ancab_012564 [Ancistrocladus abbreviatus]